MKRSKLETYYVTTFGERDVPDESDSRPVPRRAERNPPRERPGFGRRLLVRLGLAFAPMAILGIAGMMTDCSPGRSATMLPEIVRSTVCARKNMIGQASALDTTFRTLSDRMR